MKKINKILKQLSELYEFNRRLKGLKFKKRLESGKPKCFIDPEKHGNEKTCIPANRNRSSSVPEQEFQRKAPE